MLLEDRIKCFVKLGEYLQGLSDDEMQTLAEKAANENSWFTESSVISAIRNISLFLTEEELNRWLSRYDLSNVSVSTVGVVAAGNIPLVGFHDVLCVLLSGHTLFLKPSSDDQVLMNFMIKKLFEIDSRFRDKIQIVERLNQASAYIATGSDNSARYFKYYFKDKPSLIRSNRTSVAVLNGLEADNDLLDLGIDVFTYYGLGCRNVSKLFVPNDYDFSKLLKLWDAYSYIGDHHKYRNNYDYNKSIYLVNKEEHLDNGFLLLRESSDLVSPIAVLYYERYLSSEGLNESLEVNRNKTQCIVGHGDIPFGKAQSPKVDDYADGVDTMAFLGTI